METVTPESYGPGPYDYYLNCVFPDRIHPVYGTPQNRDTIGHMELSWSVEKDHLRLFLMHDTNMDRPGERIESGRFDVEPCDGACGKEVL